jgi:uncharacterized oligopeptide transporter (OPT) family protein
VNLAGGILAWWVLIPMVSFSPALIRIQRSTHPRSGKNVVQPIAVGAMLVSAPWKMELVEMLAVAPLALFLMAPILALHEANLATGGVGGRALPAPQAGLMAQLAKGIVGGHMAWGPLGIGAALGLVMILCGARSYVDRGGNISAV